MKFECIFAVNHAKDSSQYNNGQVGFLYPSVSVVDANILPSVSLCGPSDFCCNGYSLAGFGKRTASFVFIHNSNFFHTMPRSREICARANNSTPITRRGSARTASRVSGKQDTEQSLEQLLDELAEAFEVEKRAKNTAYYFILSNGLLDRFADFCRNYRSRDPHRDCVEYLLSKAKNSRLL